MGMRAKACPWLDSIFVDDPKTTEMVMTRIVVDGGVNEHQSALLRTTADYDILREAEGMEALEPVVVGMTPFVAATRNKLHGYGGGSGERSGG